MLNHFINLIFPQWCAGCNGTLMEGEDQVCTICRHELLITSSHKEHPNSITGKFYGKIPIERAFAMFTFSRGGIIQNLLHRLKYEGYYDLGVWLGRVYGTEICKMPWSEKIDLIIPVPLHPSKKKIRGYNQSEAFARGLGEILGKPTNDSILKRVKKTKTQTRMGRLERWQNVNEIFIIEKTADISGKNILLVDDVITSGATMESAGNVLIKNGVSKLFFGAIATA